MNKQQINEAMAKLEFGTTLKVISGYICETVDGPYNRPVDKRLKICPDYTADHNAVQRVIDGLDEIDFVEYIDRLIPPQYDKYHTIEYPAVIYMLKATALQKCEAILRTKGLWIEEATE